MLDFLAFGPLKPTTVCLDARVVLQVEVFWVWLAAVGNMRRQNRQNTLSGG